MKSIFSLLFCSLLISHGSSAVITGACEMDSQCGGAMCCAVSLWIRSLRMCTPMGQEEEHCHPMSHKQPRENHRCTTLSAGSRTEIATPSSGRDSSKVPFFGKRLYHMCPCLPNLACMRTTDGKFKCLPPYKYQDYYF